MIDIFLKAEQCKLALTGDPVAIAEGSKNYVRLNFDLCPDWQQMQTICANFRHHYGEQIISIPVSDNKCLVPHEILKKPELHVSLFGTTGENENAVHMTTGILYVPVLPSEIGESGEPEPDTPDIFDAILSSVAGINQAVDESAASAAEAEEQATAAATSAATAIHYAGEAAQSAQDSADSAESSAGSAAAAQSAATAAQTAAENAETSAGNAETSAGNAETAAQNSADSAADAQTAAENAQTAAENSADSAADAAESAASAQEIAQSVRDDADAGEFKGEKGDKGDPGEKGDKGDPGEGVPEGGTVGQVLTKTENGAAWEDASDPVEYPVPVNKGGTNATTAEQARENLGAASENHTHPQQAGVIYPFAGATLPDGFLWCDGAAVSRTTYATLFGVIGTTYGAGDGSSTFNLPNLNGRVPVGKNSSRSLGATGGSETHTLTSNEMPEHKHTATTASAGSHSHSVTDSSNKYQGSWLSNASGGSDWRVYTPSDSSSGRKTYLKTASAGAHTHSVTVANTGGGAAHNNMQPYQVVNYIISTGDAVNIAEIIEGITALPLAEQYGGTGKTSLNQVTATYASKWTGNAAVNSDITLPEELAMGTPVLINNAYNGFVDDNNAIVADSTTVTEAGVQIETFRLVKDETDPKKYNYASHRLALITSQGVDVSSAGQNITELSVLALV